MAEIKFWNAARAEFRDLQDRYDDFTVIRERLSSGAYRWQALCPDGAAREDFEVAATRAALGCGEIPAADPVIHWYEILSRSGAAVVSNVADVHADSDGAPLTSSYRWWGIEIRRVLKAS